MQNGRPPLQSSLLVITLLAFSGSPAFAQEAAAPIATPDNPWAVLAQVRTLVRSGRVGEALPVAQYYIRLKPAEPEGYFWQGVIFDNNNRVDEALQSFQASIAAALSAGMDSAELRLNTANELMKQGRIPDAIEQYNRAREIDPELAIASLNLGRAYMESGALDNAMQCFQRCEELHFQPPQLAYYRAKALRKAGKLEEAGELINQSINQSPDNVFTRRIKQEFSELIAPGSSF